MIRSFSFGALVAAVLAVVALVAFLREADIRDPLVASGPPTQGPGWQGEPAAVAPAGLAGERRAVAPAEHGEDPTGGRIAGRVLLTSGQAVAGAVVSASGGQRATSGLDGGFMIERLPAGEHWLRAEAQGFSDLPSPPVRIGLGEVARDVVLRLEPASAILGRVTTEEGAPIAGATVEAVLRSVHDHRGTLQGDARWSAPRTTTSNEGGEFRLGPFPRGRVELVVRHPDHHEVGRACDGDAQDLHIVLHPVGAITGVVVASDSGQPVAIDRVSLLASSDEELGPWRLVGEPVAAAPEDAALGRFQLRARTRRWVRVVVEGPGIAPVTSDPFQVDDRFAYGPLTLRAHAGRRVPSIVVDDEERPIGGVEVRWVELHGVEGLVQTGALFTRGSVLTGSDGRALSPPLAPGRYRVEAHLAGHLDCVVEPVDVGARSEEVRVVLARSGSIRGRLRTPRAGTLPRLQAQVRLPGGEPEIAYVEAGLFQFPRLAPGTYCLQVADAHTGAMIHAQRTVEVTAGSVESVELDFEALGTNVFGQCSLNGAPTPFVQVTLGRTPAASSWSCSTDRAGRFRFAGVPPGPFFLAARTAGPEGPRDVVPVTVSGAEEQYCDIDSTTGVLVGAVLDIERRPLARARVVIEKEIDGVRCEVARLRTDARGRFQGEHLPAGALLLRTEVEYHGNVRDLRCQVGIGTTTVLPDLALSLTGSLVLHLKGRTGAAASAGVEVEVQPRGLDVPPMEPLSFEPGERPTLTELPAGSVDLVVGTTNGLLARVRATVVVGKTQTVIVEF